MAILILYFKTFFTTGVYFDDTFLKKEAEGSDTHYVGKSKHGDFHHITVKKGIDQQSGVDVIYRLPNDLNKKYTVTFRDAVNLEIGIESIKNEEGNIIFEGEYSKNMPFLFDKNGDPLMEYDYIIDEEISYNADYRIPLKNVVDFSTFSNETIRGRFELLMFAIILFVLTAIDIKFPLFFFMLKNFLHVRNPEPSDLYITMQRISWYMYPIIGIILMIAAIY
ncbi:hypothetical protein HNQ80_003259 [Anaerosolibacter carboniphilus]|uniref:DUF6199 domain-containing protein n=1 Tax=Anaerosolibacter carboniphilus TaxID=1417629 RepID=A0A841KUV3_9FIRM|nr:hypothetical protein [Anaerosolibacter carboniphilus]MBB6217153.1 hypothetical protein [Anaerosolibacter carboniphilus]